MCSAIEREGCLNKTKLDQIGPRDEVGSIICFHRGPIGLLVTGLIGSTGKFDGSSDDL